MLKMVIAGLNGLFKPNTGSGGVEFEKFFEMFFEAA
jgi:hypothetical protein